MLCKYHSEPLEGGAPRDAPPCLATAKNWCRSPSRRRRWSSTLSASPAPNCRPPSTCQIPRSPVGALKPEFHIVNIPGIRQGRDGGMSCYYIRPDRAVQWNLAQETLSRVQEVASALDHHLQREAESSILSRRGVDGGTPISMSIQIGVALGDLLYRR